VYVCVCVCVCVCVSLCSPLLPPLPSHPAPSFPPRVCWRWTNKRRVGRPSWARWPPSLSLWRSPLSWCGFTLGMNYAAYGENHTAPRQHVALLNTGTASHRIFPLGVTPRPWERGQGRGAQRSEPGSLRLHLLFHTRPSTRPGG
jgi:hypothetical protein